MTLGALRSWAFLGLTLAAGAEQKEAIKPAQSQMVMTKDPVTGKLRPATRKEQEALQKQTEVRAKATAKPAHANPKMIQGPGEAVGMVLDDDSAVYSVATKGAGGKLATKEVTGKAAATKAAQSAPVKKAESGHEK